MTAWLRPVCLLALCLPEAGCSLALNWDYANLPCDPNGLACLEGYSCLPEGSRLTCIQDRSRNLDQNCLLDRQCQIGQLCPAGKCAAQCEVSLAYAASHCSENRYCAPFLSLAGQTSGAVLVAVCVPSDTCSVGMPCGATAGGICTAMGPSANACIPGCQQEYTAGTYTDNCTNQDGLPTYCTPVGAVNSEQLVCLSTGPSPGNVASTCISPVAQPCAPHLGCINQKCRTYCDVQNNGVCPSGQACCGYSLNPSVSQIGYCIDSGQCG